MHLRRKWQPTPLFLPGESQGRWSLWAAVYGVAQSWTRLMRLSSSSSNPKPRTGKYAGCSAGPTIVNHEGPYKREHRRKWRYGHDQRLKRCALRAEEGASSQEMQATSGSWKGKETDSPPKAPERLQPCQHFDFRFHTSRIVRINLCFKSLSVVIC